MPKIPNKSITKQDKLENILKYNLKARIESDHWQDAYDYMDSAKMYDDVRAAGITQEDLNKIELDATDLKEYILDTFMHLKRFKFKDSESYDYAKSICRQLGLDEVDNPFITLFKALPDVLSKKDIIALNNAYSRRYISDNMLKYNKPDKSGAPNILYNTGLYKNNSGASDIINILKASEDFTVSNKEDLKHYLNIFYTDDQVNP